MCLFSVHRYVYDVYITASSHFGLIFPGGTHVPRRPDPDLEGKILDAAQELWKKGGEKGLTMRAVAKAAGTNTPAVYRRFRNREDILRALLRRIQQDVSEALH